MSELVNKSVPQSEYTKEYFLHHCGGADRFTTEGYYLAHAHKRCFDLADIKQGDRVLDIGFGRGELAIEARKRGAEVYGIDYADAALEIARDFMKKNGIEGVTLAQAELPNLKFTDRKFNKILFLDVIEHIYEPVVLKTLDNISEVLERNGELVIHTDNKLFQEITLPIVRFIKENFFRKKIPIDEHSKLHVNFQSLNGLVRKLEARGLKIVFADYIYPKSPDDLKFWGNINSPFMLKLMYITVKALLATPLKHLICPTFDIKCRKAA